MIERRMTFTKHKMKEIDRRIDNYEHGRTKTYSWEEVKAFLNKK